MLEGGGAQDVCVAILEAVLAAGAVGGDEEAVGGSPERGTVGVTVGRVVDAPALAVAVDEVRAITDKELEGGERGHTFRTPRVDGWGSTMTRAPAEVTRT